MKVLKYIGLSAGILTFVAMAAAGFLGSANEDAAVVKRKNQTD